MMWSTPSSRYAQVVARSAFAGGIGYELFPAEPDAISACRERSRERDEGRGRGGKDVVDGQAPVARLGSWLPQVTQRARPDRDSVLSTTIIAQCSRDRDLLFYRPFSLRYMGGSIALVKLLSTITAAWPVRDCAISLIPVCEFGLGNNGDSITIRERTPGPPTHAGTIVG